MGYRWCFSPGYNYGKGLSHYLRSPQRAFYESIKPLLEMKPLLYCVVLTEACKWRGGVTDPVKFSYAS